MRSSRNIRSCFCFSRLLLTVLAVLSFVNRDVKAQNLQCIFSGTVRIDSLIPPNTTVVQLLRADSSYVRDAYYASGSYGVSALQSDGFSNGDTVRFRVLPPAAPAFIARTSGDSAIFQGGFPPVVKTVHLFRNQRPQFTIVPTDTVIDEDQNLQIIISATDPEDDPLAFIRINFPIGATLDSLTPTVRRFNWTPSFTDSGTYPNIGIRVTDGELSDTTRWTIIVRNVNRPPDSFLLIEPSDTVHVDSLVVFRWHASTDPDGDTVRYSLRIFRDTTLIVARDHIQDTTTTVTSDSIEIGSLLVWRVFAIDREDTTWSSNSLSFVIVVVGVHEHTSGIPLDFALLQNYPNPFNPSTTIRYELPKESKVLLKIYNILGQEVATLVDDVKQPGRYSVQWDAGNVASGMYLYRLQAGEFVETKKLLLLR